ncbi:MAG: energy transducer TonB [Muribaculaceae bacterium]|nr:energy transducer TonB [Muribaculaceae bacterium]
MKKKHKGKKTLTALGTVVAAGLTPGIIAATPGCLPNQSANAKITAADVVAIDGKAYSFDELYAQQRPDSVEKSVDLPELIIQAGQRNATKYGIMIPPTNVVKEKADIIFHSVEQMPQFPGGEAALMKYVQSHINYPREAAVNKIQGRVIVQFVIDEIGKVGEVKVVRSVDKDLDKEAIRVVKSLPKFTPGRQNGKAVSVWYTLPVSFQLPQKNNN